MEASLDTQKQGRVFSQKQKLDFLDWKSINQIGSGWRWQFRNTL